MKGSNIVKIIVLGADGYLGWPTTLHLLNQGYEVVAVDNYFKRKIALEANASSLFECPDLEERRRRLTAPAKRRLKVVVGDCADYHFLSELFRVEEGPGGGVDAVVHYAEQPSGPFSMIGFDQAHRTLLNNLGSTHCLIHAVLEHAPHCHVVKLGTMGEYGTPNCEIPEGWLDFEHKGRKERRLFPREAGSLYHTTKILDTDLLHFYVRTKDLSVTDLMQGPVYGTWTPQLEESGMDTQFFYDGVFGTLINRFVVQAVVGHPLTVYGKGQQIRGYLNLLDTLECVKIAIENPAEAGELLVRNQYTEEFTVNEVAERVVRAASNLGIEVGIASIPNPRKEQEKHFYRSTNQSFLDLGLKPHLLDDAVIEGMIRKVQAVKDRIEVDRIMPKVKW